MAKSLFEQLDGTYHEENGYLIPDLRFVRSRRTANRHMGTEAFELSEVVPQSYIHQSNNIKACAREIVNKEFIFI